MLGRSGEVVLLMPCVCVCRVCRCDAISPCRWRSTTSRASSTSAPSSTSPWRSRSTRSRTCSTRTGAQRTSRCSRYWLEPSAAPPARHRSNRSHACVCACVCVHRSIPLVHRLQDRSIGIPCAASRSRQPSARATHTRAAGALSRVCACACADVLTSDVRRSLVHRPPSRSISLTDGASVRWCYNA